MGNDAQASFSIDLEADSAGDSAERAASSVEELRDKILGSQSAIRDMSSALRNLRGSSDEVKSAKDELKAKINAEKDALGGAQLAALKSGESLDKFTKAAKSAAAAQDGAKQAAAGLAGPVAEASGKVDGFGKSASAASSASGQFKVAAAALIGIVLAVAAAVGSAFVALGRFVLEVANAARSANLLREATTGSAANAAALGSQIDLLATKVSLSREALNELGNGLAKSGVQGKTLVDTLNAVAGASAAIGADAGSKIQALVEAGRLSQRFSVTREQLVGSGLNFEDVAGALAREMKVGMGEARAALAEGRVGLESGAKALRDAVEKKFGEINARKMLDLNVQAQKLRERFAKLTEGVKLEPLLRGLDKLSMLFDTSTVSGAALKQIVTVVGSGLSSAFLKVVPIAAQLFKGIIIGGLMVIVAMLKLRKAFGETFGDSSLFAGVDGLALALKVGQAAAVSIAVAIGLVAAGLAVVALSASTTIEAMQAIVTGFEEAYESLLEVDWSDIGEGLVEGLIAGINSMSAKVTETVLGLATNAKATIKGALGINSPSKVFAGYGKNTSEGFAQGVDDGGPAVDAAVGSMVSTPAAASGGSSSGGGGKGGTTVNVTINAQGANEGAVKAMSEPGFLAMLTKAIEDALVSQGALGGAT